MRRTDPFFWLVFVFAGGLSLAGCPKEPDQSPSAPDMTDTTPTAVGVCFPNRFAKGNSLHVGAYCSPGGGECDPYSPGGAGICAIDVDPEGDKFCILIGCKTNADCGEKACCTGRPDNPIHACVPIECVTDQPICPVLPGTPMDGGVTDAAPSDSAMP